MMAATTGTYNFAMDGADLTIECFDRLQIRPTELTTDHLRSATRSMNLVQSRWANRGINLWEVTQQQISLTQGTATYALDPTVLFLGPEVFLTTTVNGENTDILLYPLSRIDYGAIPNKTQQGRPTSYWFDRLTTPTITLWYVPDDNGPYTLNYWRVRQQQDMTAQGAVLPDIPYRFIEAYCADITAHLAMKFKPESYQALSLYAKEVWKEASDEDREKVPAYIAPDMSSYFY